MIEVREFHGKAYKTAGDPSRGSLWLTWYHVDTPDRLIELLEYYRNSGDRVRLFYGDTATGRDWGEEYDTMGYIRRSSGKIKIPILLHNSRSRYGGAILDHCIVKLTVGGRVTYCHPDYNQPVYTIGNPPDGVPDSYRAGVFADGDNVANFTTVEKATRWVDFMTGERNSK